MMLSDEYTKRLLIYINSDIRPSCVRLYSKKDGVSKEITARGGIKVESFVDTVDLAIKGKISFKDCHQPWRLGRSIKISHFTVEDHSGTILITLDVYQGVDSRIVIHNHEDVEVFINLDMST